MTLRVRSRKTLDMTSTSTAEAITVETAPGRTADAAVIAESIRDQLRRLNSEFAHYVPAERQLPEVVLRPSGDPEYFPAGVKHRYTRRP
jgi:phenylacetate-CoA ligase